MDGLIYVVKPKSPTSPVHEYQHVIWQNLLKKASEGIDAFVYRKPEDSDLTSRQKELLTRLDLENTRKFYLRQAKDELLAFLKAGEEYEQIAAHLCDRTEKANYDYSKEDRSETKISEMTRMYYSVYYPGHNFDISSFIRPLVQRVFVDEYDSIVNTALDSLKLLRGSEWSVDKCIGLLSSMSLEYWPTTVRKILEPKATS